MAYEARLMRFTKGNESMRALIAAMAVSALALTLSRERKAS